MGHVGSKTRSLGQILEKLCVSPVGHIFSPICMKLGQNVCLDKILDMFVKLGKKVGHLVKGPTLLSGKVFDS